MARHPRLVFLMVVLVVGSLLSWLLGISLPYALLITAFAIFVNGLIATIEDDLPGGFNNPDGTSTPAYVHRVGAILRWVCSLTAGAVGVGVFTAAWQGAIDFTIGMLFALASGLLGLGLVSRQRLVQWIGIALVVVATTMSLMARII